LSITAAVLFSYQNCGVEAPQSLFDQVQKYQLPYEVKVDQIAYMSCSEQLNVPNQDGVFFTFRAGAYGPNAGLRLSDTFLYETRRGDPENRAIKLAEEYVSFNHRVLFSIRKQADLSVSYLNATNGQGIEEVDYDFVFGDLGSTAMSASLVALADTEYMNYWAAGGISQDAYMQGTMVFNSAESVSANLRSFLTDEGLLAVGFAQPLDPATLLTPADYTASTTNTSVVSPANQAFGTGLRMTFKQPNPANWGYTLSTVNNVPHVNLPKRVLASVYEYDLSQPQTIKSTWSCPTELQLRVVYPTDRNFNDPYPFVPARQLCPDVADPTNPTDLANFQIVRKSLPVSDWKINWARKCVVPQVYTKGSCYGVDTGVTPTVARSPVYDFTKSCDPAINPACLHFVSICLRP
ncbi:hypothetical protein K2X05_06455, partial [bacterium]|nr:hypothetical protein [bacterium]